MPARQYVIQYVNTADPRWHGTYLRSVGHWTDDIQQAKRFATREAAADLVRLMLGDTLYSTTRYDVMVAP